MVTPIYDADSQTLEHQIGYEVAYYNFAPVAGDARVTASLVSVAEFRPGQSETAKTAEQSGFSGVAQLFSRGVQDRENIDQTRDASVLAEFY